MKQYSRPSNQELGYFASLINSAARGDRPVGLSAADYLRHLDYHGITLLALQRGTVPRDVETLLANRKAMMVANEALKRQAMAEVFDAFAGAGLTRSILFKGGALAYTVYDQPWLRPRSDIDCLIDLEQHADFANILFDLGYQKLFAIEGELVSYQHTYSKQLAGQSVMNIDLHWRINNRQALAQSYSVSDLLANASQLDAVSSNIHIPHPVDSLLIAALHRLGHHSREERLTWLNDIHQLSRNLQPQDWQTLTSKAEHKALAAITLDALNHAERFFATQVPGDAREALRRAAKHPEASQIFLTRDLPEWRYFVADLAALPSWSAKGKLLLENLFPDREYVRQQMGTRSLSLAYLKRALRGLKRIVT